MKINCQFYKLLVLHKSINSMRLIIKKYLKIKDKTLFFYLFIYTIKNNFLKFLY